MSYHTIILQGRLTKEPDMKYTKDGKAVCSLNVAVNDGYGDNKKTIWFRVTCWEKTAEAMNSYAVKGQEVIVEGRLHHEDGNPRVYQKSDGTSAASFEVVAREVVLGAKPKNADAPVDTEGSPF
jgi:single-strand DNA-binding protein